MTPLKTNGRRQAQFESALDRELINGRPAFLGFLVKRLGNQADAEDVLQEFCFRVLARKDQLRDAGRTEAWLYSILRSALNDFFRKSGRRERLAKAYAVEQPDVQMPTDVSEGFARFCMCTHALVPDLRPRDADMVRRIDIEDEDRKAVAADLGLTTGALAVRLHRAHAVLRGMLLKFCGLCCAKGFGDCSCKPAKSRETV